MKKILSILIATVLLFSAVSCLSVGAVSGSTEDEAADIDVNIDIDPDVDLQVKKDANECFYGGKQDINDIIIIYFGTLSDGSLVVNVDKKDTGHPDVYFEDTIGDYYYSYNAGDEAYIYRDNTFYFIEKAYDTGLIDDNTLKELCEISKEYTIRKNESEDYYLYPSFSFFPKTGESGLDSKVENDIKIAAYENLYGEEYVTEAVLNKTLNLDNMVITWFGTLSDGRPVVNYYEKGSSQLDAKYTKTMGSYNYTYTAGQEAYIFQDNKLYFISDAYNSGKIDDNVLDELYAISVEYSKNPENDKSFVLTPLSEISTEATTQPQTTDVIETKPSASDNLTSSTSDTPETKPSATSDTAAIKNSNGTVQTGQNNMIIFILLIISITATTVFINFKCRD